MMTDYVCKVLDGCGDVLRIVPYTAHNDRFAVDHAIMLQLVTRGAAGFDVWQGARQVLAFQAARPPWRTARPSKMPAETSQHTLQPLKV